MAYLIGPCILSQLYKVVQVQLLSMYLKDTYFVKPFNLLLKNKNYTRHVR